MRVMTQTIFAGLLLAPALALADDAPTGTPPPSPAPPGLVEQAGSDAGYGHAGVRELGGSAGLMMSSQFRNVTVAPSFGWFVAENLELSAIASVSNVKAGTESSTVWSALVEPSYHVPFNRTTFGFLGMGVGAAYESKLGTGLAIAPRIGANFLVGRSGVLTPALQYEYISHSPMTQADVTVMAITSALGVNVGYTAMW